MTREHRPYVLSGGAILAIHEASGWGSSRSRRPGARIAVNRHGSAHRTGARRRRAGAVRHAVAARILSHELRGRQDNIYRILRVSSRRPLAGQLGRRPAMSTRSRSLTGPRGTAKVRRTDRSVPFYRRRPDAVTQRAPTRRARRRRSASRSWGPPRASSPRRPYHVVCMDDVAEAARVGKGTLYRYFPSKEDLYLGRRRRGVRPPHRQLERVEAEELPPAIALSRMIEAIVETFARHLPFFRLMQQGEARLFLRKKQVVRARRDRIADGLGRVLDRGAQTGVFRKVDRDLGPSMLIGLVWGTTLNHADDTPAEMLAQRVADLCLHGILQQSRGVPSDGLRPALSRVAGPAGPRRPSWWPSSSSASGSSRPGPCPRQSREIQVGRRPAGAPGARGHPLLHGRRAPEPADRDLRQDLGLHPGDPRRAGPVREGRRAPGRDRADRDGERPRPVAGVDGDRPGRASRSRGPTSSRPRANLLNQQALLTARPGGAGQRPAPGRAARRALRQGARLGAGPGQRPHGVRGLAGGAARPGGPGRGGAGPDRHDREPGEPGGDPGRAAAVGPAHGADAARRHADRRALQRLRLPEARSRSARRSAPRRRRPATRRSRS